jgi:hypothetical protein
MYWIHSPAVAASSSSWELGARSWEMGARGDAEVGGQRRSAELGAFEKPNLP